VTSRRSKKLDRKQGKYCLWTALPKSKHCSFMFAQKGRRKRTDADRRSLHTRSYEIDGMCRK
jgi:hypothetical protein